MGMPIFIKIPKYIPNVRPFDRFFTGSPPVSSNLNQRRFEVVPPLSRTSLYFFKPLFILLISPTTIHLSIQIQSSSFLSHPIQFQSKPHRVIVIHALSNSLPDSFIFTPLHLLNKMHSTGQQRASTPTQEQSLKMFIFTLVFKKKKQTKNRKI